MSNDEESYKGLWDELYACNNYLKIPFDTLMDMPVHVRKYWIQKYNADNTETNNYDGTKTNVINGGNINTYASLEQMKMKNTSNRG